MMLISFNQQFAKIVTVENSQINKVLKQQELTVTIEKIVPNGYGMAFADGLTVFVGLAAKGDVVRVRVREKKGKVVFAEIIEVITPSPERISPECKYFGVCGGCDFQQMTYEAQLESKIVISTKTTWCCIF